MEVTTRRAAQVEAMVIGTFQFLGWIEEVKGERPQPQIWSLLVGAAVVAVAGRDDGPRMGVGTSMATKGPSVQSQC